MDRIKQIKHASGVPQPPAVPNPSMGNLTITQRNQYRVHQQRERTYLRQRLRPPTYLIDEYEPVGRYFDFTLNTMRWNWWRGRGIPHEVSRPPVNDLAFNTGVLDPTQPWIPFKRWMMDIARMWTRPWPVMESLDLDEDLFSNVHNHDCARVNFFRVMRYRISVHKAYAFWSIFMRDLHGIVLTTNTHDMRDYVDRTAEERLAAEVANLIRRENLIMLTLIGLNNYGDPNEEHFNNRGVDELKDFIQSPAVKGPWIEFANDYLRQHPLSPNPQWHLLQPALANRDIATLRRNYYTAPNPDKTNWTLMDHSVRFIMLVYQYGLAMNADRVNDFPNWEYSWPFGNYFYSEVSATDMTDRHWFGYSLLMLLIRSWQYNSHYLDPNYDRVLVPALYLGFRGQDFDFPHADVGMVDISPKSKWEVGDDVKTKFNFHRAYACGFIAFNWKRTYDFEESDTPIHNDGYRVRTIQPPIRTLDEVLNAR